MCLWKRMHDCDLTTKIPILQKLIVLQSADVGNNVCTICDCPTSFLYRNDWKQYNTEHRREKGCFSFTIDISNTTIAGLERNKNMNFRNSRNHGSNTISRPCYSKCSKILNTKKERTPLIYFLSSPLKQREVTNFAKGGN